MEIGGSSESQNETKKGKSKTPRKPKESLLKQSQCFSLWIHYKNPILVRPFCFLSLIFFLQNLQLNFSQRTRTLPGLIM